MVQVLSKLSPIHISCQSYVHPWTDSCIEATAGLYLYSLFDSFRIYATVYLVALLMKGKIPTKDDLKKTFSGIIQSTAFLSGTAFGYSMFLCLLRRLMGHYNILTVSALPAFLSSAFAILIERPSRRLLLCLYVSNVATETLWNMALSRNMVRSLKYGEIIIYSTSIAILLYLYKSGNHNINEDRKDSMFSVLKFIVGPYEEKDYNIRSSQISNVISHEVQNVPSTSRSSTWNGVNRKSKNVVFHLVTRTLRLYKKFIQKMKCCDRHTSCPHPFSCIYYTLHGAMKMFTSGLGLQMAFKIILNFKLLKSPRRLGKMLLNANNLKLAIFLSGFTGTFRAILCLLRRMNNKDSPIYALPAGTLAGLFFSQYQDTTIALYVFWKMLQIVYGLGIDKKVLPRIPGFTIFLYCFSTATLFHAALVEPMNLRSSYWKFLHNISGGRVACMDRRPLDVWGLDTSYNLKKLLSMTRTEPRVIFYGGL